MSGVLACPLLEIPLIVFQTDVDALSEVAWVRNGPKEVGLDQCDVIKLRGAGCTSLSATWVQENLTQTHTHRHGRNVQLAFWSSEPANTSVEATLFRKHIICRDHSISN